MPYCCCVPKCNGNYDKGTKVSVFSFTKDETLKEKWVHAIKRVNFNPSATSKVNLFDVDIYYYHTLVIFSKSKP